MVESSMPSARADTAKRGCELPDRESREQREEEIGPVL